MLKEIKINKIFNINDKKYFVLSIYFIDTRILLDIITERENRDSHEPIHMPKTLEESLIESFNGRQKVVKLGYFQLLVNGKKYNSIGGRQGNGTEKYFKNRIQLPKEFIDKQLDIIQCEFEALEKDVEIKEISLINKIEVKEYLIHQEHTMQIGSVDKPFDFTYKDPENGMESSIIIKELYTEEIAEDRRCLFSCNENEKLLWGVASSHSDIKDLQLFTEKRLKKGINYTTAPMMLMEKTKNPENENLFDHRLFIGFVEPLQEKVDVVLFSITKKIYDSWRGILYNYN
ncbi:hypothetical protein [Clostridium pasteurianum]|uniref:Uncharacterized protein n=1 Tax=Clostridium pasteurianum BC1 TaxID=86416 RepID=R4K1B9_CLOPA|nr:hypothetical protein [Clostridium pasteurianum]AGK95536.1 hypothetical protein Clopa_0483 [Clostridium pasteurianum BC1]